MSGLVVVGASYAGIQAALTARDAGYAKRITVLADEDRLPYQRPPLSKEFLAGLANEENLILRDRGFFARKGIDLLFGARAAGIDKRSCKVLLSGGPDLDFDDLLIATGSHARRLRVTGSGLDGVCYLRSISDAIDLKARLSEASRIVIVGGGFIGLEVAASARKLAKKVTLVESSSRLLARAVSPIVSQFLLDMHRHHGVNAMLGETIASIGGQNGRVKFVNCRSGLKLSADLVLVGVGGLPNDQLASAAELTRADGIVVDGHGRTSEPNIFAAGDCANHYNPLAKRWLRLECVQHAQDQAKAAGLAIAGGFGPYTSVPRFWSDQYDAKLQIVGLSESSDHPVVRGSPEQGRFSVFIYRQDRLVAVESITRPGEQLIARRLIGAAISPSPAQAADLSFDLKALLQESMVESAQQ